MSYKKLTPAEERVIIKKGTEAPFTGKYVNNHEEGTYRCRQCGAPLFKSGAKFDSKSGWPSFDEAIPGPADGDMILFWDCPRQKWADPLVYFAGLGWFNSDLEWVSPRARAGEAFFYYHSAH